MQAFGHVIQKNAEKVKIRPDCTLVATAAARPRLCGYMDGLAFAAVPSPLI
jgi:hypothetical protein